MSLTNDPMSYKNDKSHMIHENQMMGMMLMMMMMMMMNNDKDDE